MEGEQLPHAHDRSRLNGPEKRPLGPGSAARGRSRLLLGPLWFFLRPGSSFAAGVGKVGPWWGRGWEDGVARLGTERLGLWSGVGPAGGRPQLRGAHCGPGLAAATRTQVMAAVPGFSPRPLDSSRASSGSRASLLCWPRLTPSPHPSYPLSSPVFSSLPYYFLSRLCTAASLLVAQPARGRSAQWPAPGRSSGSPRCPFSHPEGRDRQATDL